MLPVVVQIEDTRTGTAETCAFKRSPVRIGRNPLNDLQIQESFVSEWHAVVRFNEGRTAYLDLGATNRTVVNGQALQRNVEVAVDSETDVRIGPLRLHVLRAESPPELFGRRAKSAFAQMNGSAEGEVPSTLFLAAGAEPIDLSRYLPGAARAALAPQPKGGPHAGKTVISSVHAARGAEVPLSPELARGADAALSASGRDAALASVRPRAKDVTEPEALYPAFQTARAAFLKDVARELESVAQAQRADHALALQERHPELRHDPDFRSLLGRLGVDPIRAGQPEMEDWLRRLTEGRFPPPGARMNIALAMERVGEILEVFAQALIELRRAHERFCRELSLERYADDCLLQRTENPHALLAYLLDPHQEGAERVTQLSRALAEFALHDVGLVGAVVEGARSLLGKLSPQAVRKVADPPRDAAAFNQPDAVDKPWSFSTRKQWRKYVAQHFEMLQGDRFTRELFGREFARRYYVVTGGDAATQRPAAKRGA